MTVDQRDQTAIEREARKAVKLDRGPFRKLSCRMHRRIYRLTGGRVGGRLDSASGVRPILLLETTGRKTHRKRSTPLVYLREGDTWLVAGSNAGRDSDPGWVWNLRADPHAAITIGREVIAVQATELDDAEAEAMWPALDAMNAQYREYQKLTERTVPVVRFGRRGTSGRSQGPMTSTTPTSMS